MVGYTSVAFLGLNMEDGILTPNQDKAIDIAEARRPETKEQI